MWTQYSLIAVIGALSASRVTILSPFTTVAMLWMLVSIIRDGILSRIQFAFSMLLATLDFCGNLVSSFPSFHVCYISSFTSLVVATHWVCAAA